MSNLTHSVTISALLHDIGKVLHRAGTFDGRSHSISGADYVRQYTSRQEIIDCVRFHHKQELSQSALARESPAYIVYIADNISSGLDRREIEGVSRRGFDKNRPLESIYNIIHNRSASLVHYPENNASINYPQPNAPPDLASAYQRILTDFSSGLSGLYFEPPYINSLIELCEACLSYIPSSTHAGQLSDISLFDHSKTTAAIAACTSLYLQSSGRTDYHKELFVQEQSFYNEQAFGLLSLDISGIQTFIYTITSKGALKSLRSRSFYLEVMLENIADELLSLCELSRANLLYSGGGHAYLLLPNTTEAREKVDEALGNMNRRLMERFGTALFVAHGYQSCSGNELMSKTDEPESYTNIYRSVAGQIAAMKLRRYSPDDIRALNADGANGDGRECAVCGISGNLQERNGNLMCALCWAFNDISGELIKPDTVFTILREPEASTSLPLVSAGGNDLYLKPVTVEAAKEMLKVSPEKIVRFYSKNTYRTGLSLASKLWTGDYAAKTSEGALKTFMELANDSQGIKRLGILRADVDNLGTTFLRGFVREKDEQNKYRYVTVSRTATLSRSLSLFFKYHINTILQNPEYLLTPKDNQRNAVIVYSGGDDLFIVGAWDEVLAASIDIRRAFTRYTGGALTMSAGFSLFEAKYPISRMAEQAAALEEKAKQYQYSGQAKNAISLFGLEVEGGFLTDRHTYNWDTFENNVLGEKLETIKELMTAGSTFGSSFLYNILYLLRQAGGEKINIARLAYLLARHEPPRDASDELKAVYFRFTDSLYRWALDAEARRQLITALMIYVYTIRDIKEEESRE